MSNSRAFKVRTQEGSLFVGRLDGEQIHEGVAYYTQKWIGFSKRMNKQITVVGLGFLPAVGGQLVVDDQPYETYEFEGEAIPRFYSETVIEVEELTPPLPERSGTPEEVPRDP